MSQGYITGEIGKVTLNQPEVVTLLSPIRDAQYLKSLQNPTSTAPDAGLGVIDNPFFFVAGHYPGGLSPTGAPEDRTYFVWFGSPKGTTNENPLFSVFYARVHPERYVPNAPAEAWLDPPVLLVSYDQISSDVVNWADNVFTAAGITPSSTGVVNISSISNGTYIPGYGTIYQVPFSSTTLNFTGTPELKQLHLVYDPLDDTVLSYFSIMVPNWTANTKSIYVYKFPVSLLKNNQSVNQYAVSGLTPTTTSTPPPSDKPYFLGGVSLNQTVSQLLYNAFSGIPMSQVFSAPQFTVSFDYMKLTSYFGYELSSGYLPVVFVAVEGYMWGHPTYPHGDGIVAMIFQDIHSNPSSPSVFLYPVPLSGGNNATNAMTPYVSYFSATDAFATNGVVIDKFGSIVPGGNVGVQGTYALFYTTPSRPDYKLSSMRVRLLFLMPTIPVVNRYEPVQLYSNFTLLQNSPPNYIPGFVMATTRSIPSISSMGICRPYFTSLPDGKPKVVLGGYHSDNYLEGVALYVDGNITDPESHNTLYLVPSNVVLVPANGNYVLASSGSGTFPGYLISNFGKKHVAVNIETTVINYIASNIESNTIVNEADLYLRNGLLIGQTFPVTGVSNISALSRIYDGASFTINTGKGNKLYVVPLQYGWATAYD